MSRLHIFQKVVNVIVYLLFLSTTVYSVVAPSDDTVIQEGQTYITPCKLEWKKEKIAARILETNSYCT